MDKRTVKKYDMILTALNEAHNETYNNTIVTKTFNATISSFAVRIDNSEFLAPSAISMKLPFIDINSPYDFGEIKLALQYLTESKYCKRKVVDNIEKYAIDEKGKNIIESGGFSVNREDDNKESKPKTAQSTMKEIGIGLLVGMTVYMLSLYITKLLSN